MSRLLVEIDDVVYPLDECFWLVWDGCGCLDGSVHADGTSDEWVVMREVYGSRAAALRARRKGASVELVHRSAMPETNELHRLLTAPCEHRTEL